VINVTPISISSKGGIDRGGMIEAESENVTVLSVDDILDGFNPGQLSHKVAVDPPVRRISTNCQPSAR